MPAEEQLMELELRPEDVVGKTFYYGKGCENCNNTGYKGRQGLYEIMTLDDDIARSDRQARQQPGPACRGAQARHAHVAAVRLLAIYDGVTSIEEVVRETLTEE